MIKPIAPYEVSKDYKQLWDRSHGNSYICIIRKNDHLPSSIVAKTIYSNDENGVQVSSTGVGYIWAMTPEEFVTQCEKYELEWLLTQEIAEMNKPFCYLDN